MTVSLTLRQRSLVMHSASGTLCIDFSNIGSNFEDIWVCPVNMHHILKDRPTLINYEHYSFITTTLYVLYDRILV